MSQTILHAGFFDNLLSGSLMCGNFSFDVNLFWGMSAGGFPASSAVPFAASLALAAAGLAMYSCGGSVYAPATSEDCYRVIRCAACWQQNS